MTPSQTRRPIVSSLAAGLLLSSGALLAALASGGCEVDGFMDPSKVGRWERTPTSVPVLRRIASIEGPDDEYVEPSDPTAEDLIPEIQSYRISPGDSMLITVWNLPTEGRSQEYERLVDSRGTIQLPQLGEIAVAGLTVDGAKEVIAQTMRDRQLVDEPVLDLVLGRQRQLRFSVVGAVRAPGPYFIPEADFRLLEALSVAGGAGENPQFVYVIRQIPLSEVMRGTKPGTPAPGEKAPESGQDLINLIKELSEPKAPPPPPGSPGVMSQPASQPDRPPPIALPEAQPTPGAPGTPGPEAGEAAWMFLNGRWVRVSRAALGESAPTRTGPTPEQLVTQRVIRVPMRPLMAGDARYNVVIRPGDVIRVPPEPSGTIFISGEAVRPGAFQMSEGLTIKRAIAAAGGLNAIAIPERCDLVRMVGPEREAIIRLNLRAIHEGTQPDVFLKPNDLINIGTNFWATPLAVIRSGFRASYGFGFLLDRNFGNDVFGAPPVNQFGG